MARNRQNICSHANGGFVPWNEWDCGNWQNTCGNTCGSTCGNPCACAACGARNGSPCGRAFSFNQACPFQGGCPYPMTFEEMLNLLATLRYGRLAVCVNGTAYVTPVCFSMRRCDDTPIFTLRLRTDGCVTEHLEDDCPVTLQFDRTVNGGVCTVQAMGRAHVTGSTGCVAIVEVRADSMMGECFRNNGCGNCNSCGTAAGNNGCRNNCDNNCNPCD